MRRGGDYLCELVFVVGALVLEALYEVDGGVVRQLPQHLLLDVRPHLQYAARVLPSPACPRNPYQRERGGEGERE